MPEPSTDTGDQRTGGRRRLLAALRHPSRQQLVVGLLLAVVGFAAITQMRSYQVDDTYAGYREQALIDVLNGLAGTTQRAEAELARLEETRAELQSDTSAEQAAIEQARAEADALAVLAGTVPVTGPGIRVTITEETGQVDIDSLLDTVQEMRTAFAEAMQVNGQVRVIASTSFEDGVGGIYVDGTLLEPPYVIDVIGDPATLHGGMVFPDGPVDQLERDGASVQIEELQSLDIESVVEPQRLDYTQPGSGS
ncbi:DUF881 domain-containing protein [Nocardioides coralli]|uniref:DUF881 domain-containing protein n=1 Tax=Nocardioides coralli TaxID=2872154 RepID=UPI001CA45B34|nr:DUF881 domain-containing protein [Nocardioides coralli]QZY27718.1 DUF881 domain-containing protein [Nocardioides coralli]